MTRQGVGPRLRRCKGHGGDAAADELADRLLGRKARTARAREVDTAHVRQALQHTRRQNPSPNPERLRQRQEGHRAGYRHVIFTLVRLAYLSRPHFPCSSCLHDLRPRYVRLVWLSARRSFPESAAPRGASRLSVLHHKLYHRSPGRNARQRAPTGIFAFMWFVSMYQLWFSRRLDLQSAEGNHSTSPSRSPLRLHADRLLGGRASRRKPPAPGEVMPVDVAAGKLLERECKHAMAWTARARAGDSAPVAGERRCCSPRGGAR